MCNFAKAKRHLGIKWTSLNASNKLDASALDLHRLEKYY